MGKSVLNIKTHKLLNKYYWVFLENGVQIASSEPIYETSEECSEAFWKAFDKFCGGKKFYNSKTSSNNEKQETLEITETSNDLELRQYALEKTWELIGMSGGNGMRDAIAEVDLLLSWLKGKSVANEAKEKAIEMTAKSLSLLAENIKPKKKYFEKYEYDNKSYHNGDYFYIVQCKAAINNNKKFGHEISYVAYYNKKEVTWRFIDRGYAYPEYICPIPIGRLTKGEIKAIEAEAKLICEGWNNDNEGDDAKI